MSTHSEQAEALIAKGKRDEISLQSLIQTERVPHEKIELLSQQSSEKYINARLVLNGIKISENLKKLRAHDSYDVQFLYEASPVAVVEHKKVRGKYVRFAGLNKKAAT